MQTIRSFAIAAGLFVLLQAAQAQTTEQSSLGRVFSTEPVSAKPVFTVQRVTRLAGDTRVLTETYKDMDGNVAAMLKATYASGVLQAITFEQNQAKVSASAVFKDGRVFFTTTEDGEMKKTDQPAEGKWVPLSAVPEEIALSWDTLTRGTPLEFSMPVPIMRDHFVFNVTKKRSWTENGKRLIEFKMEASSILVRMMADPFYYVFVDDSRTLVEFKGMTIAKKIDDGKLKDLKARITYSSGMPQNSLKE